MGSIILDIAVIIEWVFATYCLFTKSNQWRMRGILSIAALAVFILLALISVIRWSFRWYGLALLLFIWAAMGVWALLRRKAETNVYEPKPIIRGAVRTMLLLIVVMLPVLIFPQTQLPPSTGNHPVATVNYTYTDPNRVETFTSSGQNREVNVECWYPKDGGGLYPLVVFSHGTATLKISNTSTFMELASNGYVVCSIDHPYHSLFTVDNSGHRTIIDNTYLQEYLDVMKGKYTEPEITRLQQKWMNLRVADINFTLDAVLAKVKDSGSNEVYRLIDPAKIGLMGHSLGGESVAQVARERSDIGAVVNLDADLAGEYVDYVNGKWTLNDKPYPVPLLNIFSDTLEGRMAAVPNANEVLAVKHIIATDPQAYEVHLPGTDHLSFTDLPVISPTLVWLINSSVPQAGGKEATPLATIDEMNALILKFFNATLKDEGTFSATGCPSTGRQSAGTWPCCP